MPIRILQVEMIFEARMSVTLTNLNVPNANFFAASSELVNRNEMAQISREILAAAPRAESVTSQNVSQIGLNNNNGLRVFGADSNLNAQTVRQIATNNAGLNVNLSQEALTAISNLNAQAAKLQAASRPQNMDGKIFIPNEVKDFSDLKSAFAINNAAQLFGTIELNKDKKGSSGLFSGFNSRREHQNNQENLSILV